MLLRSRISDFLEIRRGSQPILVVAIPTPPRGRRRHGGYLFKSSFVTILSPNLFVAPLHVLSLSRRLDFLAAKFNVGPCTARADSERKRILEMEDTEKRDRLLKSIARAETLPSLMFVTVASEVVKLRNRLFVKREHDTDSVGPVFAFETRTGDTSPLIEYLSAIRLKWKIQIRACYSRSQPANVSHGRVLSSLVDDVIVMRFVAPLQLTNGPCVKLSRLYYEQCFLLYHLVFPSFFGGILTPQNETCGAVSCLSCPWKPTMLDLDPEFLPLPDVSDGLDVQLHLEKQIRSTVVHAREFDLIEESVEVPVADALMGEFDVFVSASSPRAVGVKNSHDTDFDSSSDSKEKVEEEGIGEEEEEGEAEKEKLLQAQVAAVERRLWFLAGFQNDYVAFAPNREIVRETSGGVENVVGVLEIEPSSPTSPFTDLVDGENFDFVGLRACLQKEILKVESIQEMEAIPICTVGGQSGGSAHPILLRPGLDLSSSVEFEWIDIPRSLQFFRGMALQSGLGCDSLSSLLPWTVIQRCLWNNLAKEMLNDTKIMLKRFCVFPRRETEICQRVPASFAVPFPSDEDIKLRVKRSCKLLHLEREVLLVKCRACLQSISRYHLRCAEEVGSKKRFGDELP